MAEDTSETWTISIPTQGINITYADQATVLKFLNDEIAYYGRLGFSGASVTLANQNYGSVSLTTRAQNEISAIIIPALLYAWLLKNISRVFIQNLNLADDADHRRSLALTYMGLLQDEKRPSTDADRAIILNALFRPIPPQTNDEGPPAGIIDLIRK